MIKIIRSVFVIMLIAAIIIYSTIIIPLNFLSYIIITFGTLVTLPWIWLLIDDIRNYRAEKKRFTNLLAACKQSWFNSDFNENNFPLEPIADDESEWEVYEYCFGWKINGLYAFKKLKKLGYRLCGPRRAMEYISNGHLNNQLIHPLFVTTRWEFSVPFCWCAPVFGENYGKRYLNLHSIHDDFGPDMGWLVLRKKQSA